jgi:outer membrane protein OmpA-like peptidoglycan-associated protein
MQNDSMADGDALVEPVSQPDDEPVALLVDELRSSALELDPVRPSATTQIENKPATDSGGAASQDGAPPAESSRDLRAASRQSLTNESVESGTESEVLLSLVPASSAEDAQARQVKASVEAPGDQVFQPSVKTIYQIDFELGSVDLIDGAHRILGLAVDKMNIKAGSAALVRGFSDGTGSKSNQEELSRGRVAAVLAYMDAAGIESQRLQVADMELSVKATFNSAMSMEPGRSKVQTVEMTVAWTERD